MRSLSDFVHFWRGVPGWAPPRAAKILGPFRETSQVVGVEGGGFVMGGQDPRAYVSPSHPPYGLSFFHVVQ